MPTQTEVEYFRKKFQGFTDHKVSWSLLISVAASMATTPFDLLKARAQLLQEGRVIHGWSVNRGVQMVRLGYEVIDSGAGVRGLWRGGSVALVKGIYTGVLRTYLWCNIYNYFNKDARSKFYR
jgi:hypothetical protein